MAKEQSSKKWSGNMKSDNGGAVYGLGFVGAVVYFIQTADGFWDGVWGVIQAILWPAFVVFKLLESFYG
jgi:hypothetical protein